MTEVINDHDLLIEINTTLKRAVQDIKDLKDGTSDKIANHEKRLELLERWHSSQVISLWIYGVIGGFLATVLIYHVMGK